MNKPKVAIVHYSCPPVIGGVESVIESHTKLLMGSGYKVKIIAGKGGKFAGRMDFVEIPEIGSQFPELKTAIDNISENEKPFDEIVGSIVDKLSKELEDVSVCFVHNVITMHFNLALAWAIKKIAENGSKTKFINWVHDMTLVNPDYPEVQGKKDYPWSILSERVNNMEYIAISDLRQQQAIELYNLTPEEINIVPNGVDISSFLELSPFVSELLISESLDEQDIVAFTPTRILKRKNLEAGIKLTKCLKDAGKKVKWMITGAPDPHNLKAMEYYHYLTDLIKEYSLEDNVSFLSAKYAKSLSDKDIKSLYRVSNVLFFLSSQEGFGIPILEAGLTGCLVVISDIPSLAALGGSEAIHISLKNENFSEKADEMISYLNHSIRYRLFKRIVSTYTWHSIFKEKIESLIKN